MLREIDLRKVKIRDVTFPGPDRWVTIWLPTSKTDQQGRGIRHTLRCCDAVLSAVPEGNRDCQEQDSAAGIPTFLVVGQPEAGGLQDGHDQGLEGSLGP